MRGVVFRGDPRCLPTWHRCRLVRSERYDWAALAVPPQKNLETELTGARGAPVRPMGSLPRRSPMAPGHRDWFPAKPDISPSLSARAYLNSLAESAGWRGGCGEGLAGRVHAWPWGAGSRRAPGVTGARGSGHNGCYARSGLFTQRLVLKSPPPAVGVPFRGTRGCWCGIEYNSPLCRGLV